MGFRLNDPFGSKRRGKKKRRAAEAAAARTERAGRELQADILGIRNRLEEAGTEAIATTERAAGVFDPFVSAGTEALETQLSALGVGGREFDPTFLEQTPGFQFAKEQGLQAGERAFGAAGISKSGRAAKELARFSSGLAQNTFQSFIDNLSGIIQGGRGAAFGQAQVLQGQAGLQTGLAENLARIETAGAQAGFAATTGASDLRLSGELAQIEASATSLGQILSLGGQIGGAIIGGPAGAAIGGNIGGLFGGGGGGAPKPSPGLTPNQEAALLPSIF